jgi:hypothetical protein
VPVRDPNAVKATVVIRRDQHVRLDSSGKSRSDVVREALDRYFSIVPDAEIPEAGTDPAK